MDYNLLLYGTELDVKNSRTIVIQKSLESCFYMPDLLSGLIVSSTTQLIELGGELVLVETGVLQGQLHLVQLLGGVLGLHLEPLLGAGHVGHAPVEVSDLDVVLVDGDLKLFNNLQK